MQKTSPRMLSLTSAPTLPLPGSMLNSSSRLWPNRAVTFDLWSSCRNYFLLLSKVRHCTMRSFMRHLCLFCLSPGSPSGKLTVADHRCSVLSAIESLSLCPLSSSSQQQLASSVAEGLVTHIKQEGKTYCNYFV